MKINFKYYFERALSLLRIRQKVGGVEVSDAALRLVYFDGKGWHFGVVRLTPGVVDAGKINDYGKFVSALKDLKSQVFGVSGAKKQISVVVSLSSVSIYSQVFSLPLIEGENLNKAIELNIQMVSPVDVSQSYSGWQTVGQDKDALRLEILSAFIDKNIINEVNRAFAAAGFLVVVVESRALALARLMREDAEGLDVGKSYILLNLDDSGLDFLIVRQGQLYFEYFNHWRDLADEKGQISTASFSAAIVRNLHQVINFYGQHWPEPLEGIILSATALKDEMEKTVGENFSLKISHLKLRPPMSLGSEWFVSFGCGLRGIKPRAEDRELSLLGVGAEEEFRREQLVAFAEFWRLLLPAAFALLFVMFLVADLFLMNVRGSLESRSSSSSPPGQTEEGVALESKANDFNRSVAMIGGIQNAAFPKSVFLEKVSGLALSNGITLTRLNLSDIAATVELGGQAVSEDQVVSFKNALAADSEFTNVNLPLTNIKAGSGGLVFSLSFNLKH